MLRLCALGGFAKNLYGCGVEWEVAILVVAIASNMLFDES